MEDRDETLVKVALIVGVVVLALNGVTGWGWLLFILLLIA